MAKLRRKWPDHPLVGLKLTYKSNRAASQVEVVDCMPGPMLLDTSSLDQPEARIEGTLKLRLRHLDTGAEFWSLPLIWDGKTVPKSIEAGNG
ncbi:MAG: hypothetical protein E6Q88_04280 [Lysobacteraceae bacterium]|nr:MAG: hypothetical protein E6Q88_04280 [Xanthomonadaceae bacterium]